MTDHVNGSAHGPDDSARLLAQWREAVASETAALEAANTAGSNRDASQAYDAATQRVRALARAAWERPVSGPADVRLRAEIAKHRLWGHYSNSDGVPRFEAVLSSENAEEYLQLVAFDERAVAELVKAVLWAPQPAADTPAGPDRRPASGDPSQRPDILEFNLRDKIETVGDGMAALHTLVHRFADNEDDLHPDLRISLMFCIGQINEVLEGLEKLVESVEVRPKAPA